MCYELKKEEIMKYAAFLFIFICSMTMNAKKQKLKLQNAIDGKYVKAQALSLGGYQNYCINMHLANLSTDTLVVIIEAGRRLNSMEEKDQDILITREEIIVLKKKEEKWVPVYGYCCQANNHSPKTNAKYDIYRMADSNLVHLANFLNKGNFESNVAQQAIWAVSDNQSSAQVCSGKDSSLFPLRKLVCALKGEQLPWYTIRAQTLVYQSGAMTNFPIELNGKLHYKNEKECYTTLHVLNSKGIEVCKIVKQWTMPGEFDYDLSIPVKGLAKGNYTVELRTPEKELVKRDFKI